MVYEIDDKILDLTTRCLCDFLCICDEPGEICPVERVIPGTALYINPKEHCYCAYLRTYGAEFVCSCPVRRELYEKYNI